MTTIDNQPQHTATVDGASGVLRIDLAPGLSAALADGLRPIAYPRRGAEDAYVSGLRRLAYQVLSPELLAVFDGLRSGASTPTAVLFTGLPYDNVLSAPKAGEQNRDRKPSDVSENLCVLLAALIGDPYGAQGEGLRLVNEVIPTEEDRLRFTGAGSEVPLDYHTEHAGFRRLLGDRDLSPQGLMLIGVCAPDEGAPKTWVSNGRLAMRLLSDAQLAELQGEAARLAIPVRQRRAERDPFLPPSPLLAGPAGAETITGAFYGDMLEPTSADAAEAVAAFKAALKQIGFGLVIRPGSAVYVPNGYTLHARDPFTPTFDHEGRAKRWLQRVFVTGRLDLFGAATSAAQRVFELPKP